MAKERGTGTTPNRPGSPVGEEIPRHRMEDLFEWVEKGRVDQAEETLRRRLEHVQAPLEVQLGQLRTNQEKLIDRFSALESEQLDDLRRAHTELGKELHALENRQLSDEIHAKQWQFLTKYVLPVLTALVFSLFAWVWNSHSTLVQLQGMHHAEQGRLDALVSGTKDRYTAQEAEADLRYFESRIAKARDKMLERIDKIDDRIRKLEIKPE